MAWYEPDECPEDVLKERLKKKGILYLVAFYNDNCYYWANTKELEILTDSKIKHKDKRILLSNHSLRKQLNKAYNMALKIPTINDFRNQVLHSSARNTINEKDEAVIDQTGYNNDYSERSATKSLKKINSKTMSQRSEKVPTTPGFSQSKQIKKKIKSNSKPRSSGITKGTTESPKSKPDNDSLDGSRLTSLKTEKVKNNIIKNEDFKEQLEQNTRNKHSKKLTDTNKNFDIKENSEILITKENHHNIEKSLQENSEVLEKRKKNHEKEQSPKKNYQDKSYQDVKTIKTEHTHTQELKNLKTQVEIPSKKIENKSRDKDHQYGNSNEESEISNELKEELQERKKKIKLEILSKEKNFQKFPSKSNFDQKVKSKSLKTSTVIKKEDIKGFLKEKASNRKKISTISKVSIKREEELLKFDLKKQSSKQSFKQPSKDGSKKDLQNDTRSSGSLSSTINQSASTETRKRKMSVANSKSRTSSRSGSMSSSKLSIELNLKTPGKSTKLVTLKSERLENLQRNKTIKDVHLLHKKDKIEPSKKRRSLSPPISESSNEVQFKKRRKSNTIKSESSASTSASLPSTASSTSSSSSASIVANSTSASNITKNKRTNQFADTKTIKKKKKDNSDLIHPIDKNFNHPIKEKTKILLKKDRLVKSKILNDNTGTNLQDTNKTNIVEKEIGDDKRKPQNGIANKNHQSEQIVKSEDNKISLPQKSKIETKKISKNGGKKQDLLLKTAWGFRFELQKNLIEKANLTDEELKKQAAVFKELEEFNMTLEYLASTKLYKVLREILQKKELELNDTYKFHLKSKILLVKWKQFIMEIKNLKSSDSQKQNPENESIATVATELQITDSVDEKSILKKISNNDVSIPTKETLEGEKISPKTNGLRDKESDERNKTNDKQEGTSQVNKTLKVSASKTEFFGDHFTSVKDNENSLKKLTELDKTENLNNKDAIEPTKQSENHDEVKNKSLDLRG
ncbi:uncharacterized protein ASCRUDRAFT_144302 [Ascoidea rubescens DSM 1968]|uniref:PWWP domain-containing protein n=1 Tax=Ascoidea rubescens DSM 1968 TaxID=1344418 RepID=A0A1D2VJE3_9ASCO|nr:hypothetical protein ASCRUDRAFT_144302 [Ascoidea rubescens DSM 1968]ODV61683.1 hypothetical protein ASCRUDRAFT_144302 [Ascoidea rubescens DSM 1968]